MRVFSIFCTYISEEVFKPHFKKSSEEVQTICTIPQDGSHSSSSGCGKTPAEGSGAAYMGWRRVYAAVRGADAGGRRTYRSGTGRRMGQLRHDAAAGGRRRLCTGGRCVIRGGGGHHRTVLPAQNQRKTEKRCGEQARPTRKRRRKANEKTNTQYPAAVLHGADHAADNGLCCG